MSDMIPGVVTDKAGSDVLVALVNQKLFQNFQSGQLLFAAPTVFAGTNGYNTQVVVTPNPTPGGNVPVTKWDGTATLTYKRVDLRTMADDIEKKLDEDDTSTFNGIWIDDATKATVTKLSDLIPVWNNALQGQMVLTAADIVDGAVDVSTLPVTVTFTAAAGSFNFVGACTFDVHHIQAV